MVCLNNLREECGMKNKHLCDIIINETTEVPNNLNLELISEYIKYDGTQIYAEECEIASNQNGILKLDFYLLNYVIATITTEYNLSFKLVEYDGVKHILCEDFIKGENYGK